MDVGSDCFTAAVNSSLVCLATRGVEVVIEPLLRRIEAGDLVVVPLKTREGQIAIGRVNGPYQYRADAPDGFRRVRPVHWLCPGSKVK